MTAGKYNDGAPENRPILSERVYRAMVGSEQNAEEIPSQALRWMVKPVHFTPRPDRSNEELLARVTDAARSKPERCWAAFELAFRRRVAAGMPVVITGLHLSENVCVLHLPGEALIEYQLYAQALRPDAFIAVASYGDLGMSYIPLARHFQEVGGYEDRVAYAAPETETLLKQVIQKVIL
jgi:hypothetical protein